MTNRPLLKHLDQPIRILSLSIPDLVGYLIPFFLGALLDHLLLVSAGGMISVYFLKRALKKFPRFYLLRSIYWSLPSSAYNRITKTSLPPSAKRKLVK